MHSELWAVWKFFTIMCYHQVAVGEKSDLFFFVCACVSLCVRA